MSDELEKLYILVRKKHYPGANSIGEREADLAVSRYPCAIEKVCVSVCLCAFVLPLFTPQLYFLNSADRYFFPRLLPQEASHWLRYHTQLQSQYKSRPQTPSQPVRSVTQPVPFPGEYHCKALGERYSLQNYSKGYCERKR